MYLKCLLSFFCVSLAFSADFNQKKTVEIHQTGKEINKSDKVDVRLYYECLCPFCKDFYIDTLNKTVAVLASYMDLKTYPYGKAKMNEENGKTVFTCQHGPKECYGNKLHACAIDLIKNTSRYVYYTSCMMKGIDFDGSTDKDAFVCGKQMGIDGLSIIQCAKGERGDKLLEYYGKETDKDVPDLHEKGVPWPLINGKYYDDVDDFDKFYAKICDSLKHPPQECKRL